ncbi:IKI3 family-domain-containing protein [Leucosporidium creatinivorum]|uniref:Elongator complex protein 1 n=1 Tax=Leucosporidium creatinivorum TaxID=106004 RepID=A0A1Y2D5L2_9BASI|nr:IKI3 family-domain-containing protein [Leucosporidium creatinivorum]
MRSLLLLAAQPTTIPAPDNSARVTAVTTDPATDALYLVQETPAPDGTALLSLFSLPGAHPATQPPTPIISWSTESLSSFSNPEASSVVSFKYLPESDSLCLVLSNGDIEQVYNPAGPGEATRENVGTFDLGIKAAEWSPDEELLAIVTGDDQLLSMTKDFEPLSEGPLRSSDFGADAPVNVGWGSKSSQFHGSAGKSAAQAPATPDLETIRASPEDDGRPRISWRGDSAWFAGGEPRQRRVVRVFSRVAELSSTSEPTGGLEHPLAWQPSGSIIAATQRKVDKEGKEEGLQVVFFERNGLRRYEFALREKEGARVRELSWNSDSTLLAVWVEREGGSHAVQLWHRNNYNWTLKQEISPRLSGSKAAVTSLLWNPEKALELHLTTNGGIESFTLSWDTFASARPPPSDEGAVAVVDGANIRLTPFRLVNIPPPMSATVLPSSRPSQTPSHISFSTLSDASFIALYPDGFFEVWDWSLTLDKPKGKMREEIVNPTLSWSASVEVQGEEGAQRYARQCAVVGQGEEAVVAVLCSTTRGSEVVLVRMSGEQEAIMVTGGARRLVAGVEGFVLESAEGTVLEVPATSTSDDPILPSDDLPPFPEFCAWIHHLSLVTTPLLVGLSDSGRLYAGTRLLASDATSFTTTPDFLIYTTFSHEAKFVPLFTLERGASTPFVAHTEGMRKEKEEQGAIKRAVERGSKIVTVVPSSTTLVLQMPRGNLEVICPRPLVLRIVRQDLDQKRYRAAFLACRRHRIDLNILYDHDPASFKANLADFVAQVKEVDHLNLFLSGLKDEDVTSTMYRPLIASDAKPADTTNKINLVCDMIRGELEKGDVFHYANTILTAHVRKQPQDYESALKVLVELKAKDAARAEDAVKYIIFLSDANKLFDLALGMYDFPLVLMIAQHSQKDPREYLPFLRELRQLETHIQRHRIDDHLGRHESALRNLALAGPDRFEEALAYTIEHDLFTTALQAFKEDSTKYKIILCANAEYLVDHKKYTEAGLLFALGGQPAQAISAYTKANAWQELFNLAMTEGKRTASEIKALAVDVADNLRAKRRFTEAGRVLLEYGRDVEAAVGALVEGAAFAEALRLTSLYNRRDLIETHIKPGTLEVESRLVDDFNELTEQVEKQVERLAELKEKRDANPYQYFCLDDPTSAIDNVELQPDGASDAGTAFTRYTAAPTTQATSRATSQRSSRTARSRRRAGIKKAAGKKGSIYEETYLLNSLKKSLEVRLAELQGETAALLPILLTLGSSSHRLAATNLQQELTTLENFLRDSSDTLWGWREKEWAEESKEEHQLRERGEWVEKPKPEEGTEKVERPKLAKEKWRIGVLDV